MWGGGSGTDVKPCTKAVSQVLSLALWGLPLGEAMMLRPLEGQLMHKLSSQSRTLGGPPSSSSQSPPPPCLSSESEEPASASFHPFGCCGTNHPLLLPTG